MVPSDEMVAACGHVEIFGYLTNTPCYKCVREAHAKAMGKGKR